MPDDEANTPNEDWAALSSMVDGEAAPGAQAQCLAIWAQRADARERWRSYQLIGDVLRSGELARDEAHDAAFLAALRARLAVEPPVLRPKAETSGPVARRLRTWGVPVAAAAGVAVVAGVTIVLRTTVPVPPEPAIAARGAEVPLVVASEPAAAAAAVAVSTQAVSGRLIRDARLDRYFAAHRQSANGTALQMPGAGVRNVDTIVLEDR
jgi:sigma-E factor negative regulatory protein RseA